VFACDRGFVTDMGGEVAGEVLTDGRVVTLPRYGVWKPTGQRHEVVLTTDDLAEAKAAANS
jgi:hypothetical protein